MTTENTLNRYFERFPLTATALYVGLIVVLAVTTWMSASTLVERSAAVDEAGNLLAQLDNRRPMARPAAGNATDASTSPAGSPFLEGETVTVAGAALLQRVAGAVTRVGGNLLSSQVDVQGTQSKDGYVSLVASCQVDQAALQQLIYDLEAGMPFLFIDQLVAQAPLPSTEPGTGRMRIMLAVSGQWEGRK
jgi:general secretion pathway protein M